MKFAVVGSGVSSLATTWNSSQVLNQHSLHEVYLYEVEGCAGGHTNTIVYIHPDKSDGYAVDVDTLATSFCQSSRLLDPDMWRLIYDVLGFSACARRLVSNKASSDDPDLSCLMNIPARTLVRFMSNHHLSQITGKPSCLTIEGGGRNCVDAILSKLPKERVHLSSPVTTICGPIQGEGRHAVLLKTHNQMLSKSCHSDACTTILKGGRDLRDDQEDILERFEWNADILMPKARTAWSCWNYLTFCSSNDKGKHKANINKHLPKDLHGPMLATLNPPTDSNVTKPAARFAYERPILDTKAMTNIQGRGGVLFAGAWLGYGVHEDGFTSDLRAVLSFDVAGADREPCVPFLEITGICAVVGTALTLALLIVQS
ncbi:hypothetical protein DFJ58DRAFT_716850 [Suillus subalutaceus]|uniref:uncharacterized protein n=1 Tax=Suillus subalutaceus TaxID=48586 RepID=UPI001B886557|nr:uncharacterized protein DFJ58DRAFT_716850 [Suillus subalutaceus]KAG1849883.1 hypothetical protein DFJ58DRAFT_716850 [Suillus subalutaceus]